MWIQFWVLAEGFDFSSVCGQNHTSAAHLRQLPISAAGRLAAVFELTNILGAWQHTLATSALTCDFLTAFL
jgi:hypothetical protein